MTSESADGVGQLQRDDAADYEMETAEPGDTSGEAPYGETRMRVEDETSWRDLLVTRTVKKGDGFVQVVAPNLSNVLAILRHHPKWKGVLAWDAFGERVIARAPPPWHPVAAKEVTEAGVYTETDTGRIVDWLARAEELTISAKLVEQAVPIVAEANAFHPVREYLQGLEWDGVERLPTWLSVYCGVKQSEYSALIGTRWMISAVARPMEPGCQVDCMLVLEGAQGVGKSSVFRALVPNAAFYSETGVTIGDKDSYQCLHGVWIYLQDELDSLRGRDVTKVKNFLTSLKDHFRPSYGRVARDFFRQNVFAGTTNESEYFADRTGNRRLWPARVVGPMDIPRLRRDRDQLWAEAFHRYANCEPWYADTPELRKLCEEQQAERLVGDPWEHIIEVWLGNPRLRADGDTLHATGVPFDIQHGVTTAEVLAHAIGKPDERITRADEMRIAEALRELGYERGPMLRKGGTRTRRYMKVEEVVTVVTVGGDGLTSENHNAYSLVSLPSLPQSRTHEETGTNSTQKARGLFRGGDGGDSDDAGGSNVTPLFDTDMADLGVYSDYGVKAMQAGATAA